MLICPNCKERLFKKEKSFRCENNHSFDVAKEGYINLLLVNEKKKKDPGDNDLMLKARESFLGKGYYEKLCNSIINITNKIFGKEYITILDAGCGTGYYLRKIIARVNCNYSCGVDISKFATKIAAKNDKKSTYIVSSIFKMPIKNNAFDVILNIFAPKPQEEFSRVLKKDGIIIEVLPGEKHMLELRQLLYDRQEGRIEKIKEFAGYKKEIINVKYNEFVESSEDIENLLKMTPYWYKTSKEALLKIGETKEINVTFDFIINIWRKENENF